MEFQSYIQKITEGQTLSSEDMTRAMTLIMTGEATPAQIGGFLIGLRVRGETVDEISAAAQVMRQLATPVNTAKDYLVDTCGTGGDASGTFNISTTSAFVAAAAGLRSLSTVIARFRVNQVVRTYSKRSVLILILPLSK